jgi:hypothetical protein
VLYTPEAIVAELDGLTVRRAERIHRPVDTAPESAEAVDTLVRATRKTSSRPKAATAPGI